MPPTPAAIPFRKDFSPAYGIVERVSPLIRRIVANNPGPYTFTGTGTYIIGYGDVAVIDPGPVLPSHIEALKGALAGETVSHILVTHTHIDHSPASTALQQATGAPIYAFGPHGDKNGPGKNGTDDEVEEGADRSFRPDHLLKDGELITGNGWTIEALHTPGHTSNHLCFALREEQALFTGDHVMGWSTSVISPPDGDMNDYMKSLHRLVHRDDRIYWPTHGLPIENPQSHVKALIAHRQAREQQIMACVRQGTGRIPDMVAAIYADVPEYLHPAAARSVYAHIIHMVETDRLACTDAPSLQNTYKLADK